MVIRSHGGFVSVLITSPACKIFSVIVRVYIEDRLVRDSGVNYRCIRVTEHDRVKQVLSVALAKHNLVAEQPQNWNLTQKLTPKELTLPDNANVFHAIDKTPQNNGQLIEFVIRRKTKEEIQDWLKFVTRT